MHGWRFLWKRPVFVHRKGRHVQVAPWFIPRDLEKLFRHKVFKMLLSRKKIEA